MKKVVVFVLLMLMIGLTACSGKENGDVVLNSESVTQSAESNSGESLANEEEDLFEAPVERMRLQNNPMKEIEKRFLGEYTGNQRLEEYLKQQEEPFKDAFVLVQSARGCLDVVHSILDQMWEYAEMSAYGTYNDAVNREMLQQEFETLREEIDRICETASCDGRKLFADATEVTVEVDSEPVMTIELEAMSTSLLNIEEGSISIASPEAASEAIDILKSARDIVSTKRANLEAWEERLEHSMINMP